MRFKVKSTDVYISFSFLAVMLVMILNGNSKIYFITLLSSLLHESVHLLFMSVFHYPAEKITFTLFGGNIKRRNFSDGNNIHEAIINLSAPITNIVVGVFLLCIFDEKQWSYINIFLGAFNILPFYNFDGGRGLYFLLNCFFPEKFSNRIIFATSLLSLIIFSVFVFCISFSKSVNVVFIVINMYLLGCFLVKLFNKSSDNG